MKSSLNQVGRCVPTAPPRDPEDHRAGEPFEPRRVGTTSPYLAGRVGTTSPYPPGALVLWNRQWVESCMQFTIEPVKSPDLAELLEMIRELARFEQLEHEVEATVQLLDRALFGPTATAGGLLARQGQKAVGYALYFLTFSTFTGRQGIWLDDVYVRPEFRRHGLGRQLIAAVAQIGVQRDCARFEWTALNWNKNALDFYKRLGARTLDDWVLLRLNADGLRRVAGEELNRR